MRQVEKINIQNRKLLRRSETLNNLSEQDKTLAKEVIDFIILKKRFQELMGPA